MTIAHIYDGELGFDVRTKLNDVIDIANAAGGGGGMPPYVFLSCNVVEDNALAGTVVGTLSVIGLSGFSFSLTYNPSGKFSISGANLQAAVNLAAADDGMKPVTIRAFNGVTRYDYGYVVFVIPSVTIPYSPTYYIYGF